MYRPIVKTWYPFGRDPIMSCHSMCCIMLCVYSSSTWCLSVCEMRECLNEGIIFKLLSSRQKTSHSLPWRHVYIQSCPSRWKNYKTHFSWYLFFPVLTLSCVDVPQGYCSSSHNTQALILYDATTHKKMYIHIHTYIYCISNIYYKL